MYFGWAIFGMVVVFIILLTILALVVSELSDFTKYLHLKRISRGRPRH
jgi:Na+-transporting methylmalonyl-CoA/oxaloacetate decarboxylase gamma subunit